MKKKIKKKILIFIFMKKIPLKNQKILKIKNDKKPI